MLTLSFAASVALLSPIRTSAAQSVRLCEPTSLAQDLDQLIETVTATHPNIGYTANLPELHSKVNEIRRGLSGPLDVRNAWMRLAQLNPLFRDAHVGLQFPVNEFTAYRQGGGTVFPLPVYVDEADRVRIAEGTALPGLLAAHEEIVSINDQSMQVFLSRAMPLMRGETRNIQKLVLVRNFAGYLWTLNGGAAQYSIVIRDAGGRTRRVSLPATSEILVAGAPGQAFRFESVRSDIGYLRIGSFDIRLKVAFEAFLADSFAALKRSGTRKLIIDLRDNSGGAHELSDLLLQYLSGKPTRQASALRARIIDANRSIAPSAKLGDVVQIEHDEWLQPLDSPIRFDGETLLLIGPRTYSQAIVFSATFQDFKLGRVIGEPTDGWANQTGQVHMTPLACTGLLAAAPLYIIYRPSGDRAIGGVQPDVAIDDDPANPMLALEKAIRLLQ
jgi:C-terminal processing protease CtpA/Prc